MSAPATTRGLGRRSRRGRFDGALEIVRFNWPAYVLAAAVVAASLLALPMGGSTSRLAVVALLVTVYLTVASVVVSHWVYDRSAIAHWEWVPA